jgi:hypothetical protein
MNRERYEDEFIELGSASLDTKGGPRGHEDTEGSLWLMGGALTED